jgi:hypothetical protein
MQEDKTLERLTQEKRTSLVGEFWEFLGQNKKWWLLPFILVLLMLSLLVLLSSSALAPGIYPLFYG